MKMFEFSHVVFGQLATTRGCSAAPWDRDIPVFGFCKWTLMMNRLKQTFSILARDAAESSRVTEAARVSFVFNFLISPPCSVFSVTTSVQRVTRQPRWSMRFPNRSATTSPWRRSARSSRRRTARSVSWNTVRREECGSSRLTNGWAPQFRKSTIIIKNNNSSLAGVLFIELYFIYKPALRKYVLCLIHEIINLTVADRWVPTLQNKSGECLRWFKNGWRE